MEVVMDIWTDVFINYKHPYGRQCSLNILESSVGTYR